MEKDSRIKEVLQFVLSNGKVSTKTLAKKMFVSEMTVRRILKQMENDKLIKRYHGGAIKLENSTDYPIRLRKHINEEQKKLLAQKASYYLKDNIKIFIDSSSTCSYLIPYLKNYKGLTVITNSVRSLLMIADLHIPCILIGGNYDETDMCLNGCVAEQNLSFYNSDLAFITTTAISLDGTISDINEEQCNFKKIAIKNAKKIVALYTKNKVGKIHTYNLCRKEQFDIDIIKA